jgi:hypothetical protein
MPRASSSLAAHGESADQVPGPAGADLLPRSGFVRWPIGEVFRPTRKSPVTAGMRSSADLARRPSTSPANARTGDPLAKLLGVLGSEHARERDAAARAIERLRRRTGLTMGGPAAASPGTAADHHHAVAGDGAYPCPGRGTAGLTAISVLLESKLNSPLSRNTCLALSGDSITLRSKWHCGRLNWLGWCEAIIANAFCCQRPLRSGRYSADRLHAKRLGEA